MSWSDPCSNCGAHRADCECGDWNGYKRGSQLKETWIKNVVKIQNLSREEAESLYDKIQPHKSAQ